jgi:hypothetical protein
MTPAMAANVTGTLWSLEDLRATKKSMPITHTNMPTRCFWRESKRQKDNYFKVHHYRQPFAPLILAGDLP